MMELYKNREKCCGCGSCFSICPVNAISMEEDENGFLFPQIDSEKCINCGACIDRCQFHFPLKKHRDWIPKVYGAQAINQEFVQNSTSAGIFATLCRYVLKRNGVAFGVTLMKVDGNWQVCHIPITETDEIVRLQGSKYVQSRTNNSFKICKHYLEENRLVLFSGTPCQIAGLYHYLGRQYDNLFTVDIVCHGTPSQQLFREMLKDRQGSEEIEWFRFRSKVVDEGHNIHYAIRDKKNHVVEKSESGYCNAYNKLFLDGSIYQESCYSCMYAQDPYNRPGDLTICDFWGYNSVHSEYPLHPQHGISGVIVNSKNGDDLFEEIKNEYELIESSIEKLSKYNGCLRHPIKKPKDYDAVQQIFQTQGYTGLKKYNKKKMGLSYYAYRVFFGLPKWIKRMIRSRLK